MKREAGMLLAHRRVALGQNGCGVTPQVRSNTSGSTSIAMSQRTPSHLPAIVISSPIMRLLQLPDWRS